MDGGWLGHRGLEVFFIFSFFRGGLFDKIKKQSSPSKNRRNIVRAHVILSSKKSTFPHFTGDSSMDRGRCHTRSDRRHRRSLDYLGVFEVRCALRPCVCRKGGCID